MIKLTDEQKYKLAAEFFSTTWNTRVAVGLVEATEAEVLRINGGGGEATCEVCGGSGVDPDPHVYPVCCNRPSTNGECCGSPEPALEPQACRECSRPSAPQPQQAAPGAVLEPKSPNSEGQTMCCVRWVVDLPNGGWLGAWDKESFSAYASMLSAAPKPQGE